MTVHRDGHTLGLTLVDMGVNIRVSCPFDGKAFAGYNDWPVCRRQTESHPNPVAYGHYLRDECVVAELVAELGVEAIGRIPKGQEFDVTSLPVAVEWEAGEGEFWIRPIPAETVPDLDWLYDCHQYGRLTGEEGGHGPHPFYRVEGSYGGESIARCAYQADATYEAAVAHRDRLIGDGAGPSVEGQPPYTHWKILRFSHWVKTHEVEGSRVTVADDATPGQPAEVAS
ncbi:MAG TPA: hypothetical protein VFM55_19250 [Micromonosporaceae bacterium]|nr:hypothetical protein [Micromonosporaceae bacterium]